MLAASIRLNAYDGGVPYIATHTEPRSKHTLPDVSGGALLSLATSKIAMLGLSQMPPVAAPAAKATMPVTQAVMVPTDSATRMRPTLAARDSFAHA